jgi:hypothetical protein
MKGILFGGCSFTWGQGLYFYSELNRLTYPVNEFTYNDATVNDAHRKFRDTLRYPRLVANHFKTFEVFKIVLLQVPLYIRLNYCICINPPVIRYFFS